MNVSLSRGRLQFALFVGGALLAMTCVTPARAGFATCSYDSSTQTMTVTAASDFHIASIGREGDVLEEGGAPCGDATRFNTDTIVVNDTPNHDLTVFVQLEGGPLRPGATNEAGSSDEIELEFNLGNGSNNLIVSGSKRVTAGTTWLGGFVYERRVNINAGERTGVDHEFIVSPPFKTLSVNGTDGDDMLSAAGGAGTGGFPFFSRVEFRPGETGKDLLIGGGGDDGLSGYKGADTIRGGLGHDLVNGGSGGDTIRGNEDNDSLNGDSGNDTVKGGPGTDDCDGGPGTDTLSGCE